MKTQFLRFLVVGILAASVAAIAAGDDAKDEAIKKDRKRIQGTWRIVTAVLNGQELKEEETKKFTVVNGNDGTWKLLAGSEKSSSGTSTIDPTKNPKNIDFTAVDQAGNEEHYLGIYELGENTRKLCFSKPGMNRPTEFASTAESGTSLVTFERAKDK